MESAIQVISEDIFQDKVYGGVLNIDDVYHYLLDEREDSVPVEIEFAALFICLAGESEIMLDMKAYHIQAGDLCVIFPHSVIQGIRKSEDFDGYALDANLEYISMIQIPSTMTHFLQISENPCISLTAEEQGKLLKICELVKDFQEHPASHLFHEEVMNKLLLALCYEIVGIYTAQADRTVVFHVRQAADAQQRMAYGRAAEQSGVLLHRVDFNNFSFLYFHYNGCLPRLYNTHSCETAKVCIGKLLGVKQKGENFI